MARAIVKKSGFRGKNSPRRPEQPPDLAVVCLGTEAGPESSRFQGARALMGQRGAVEPRPQAQTPPGQLFRRCLAVSVRRQEGQGPSLVGAREYPKAHGPKTLRSPGGGLGLPMGNGF